MKKTETKGKVKPALIDNFPKKPTEKEMKDYDKKVLAKKKTTKRSK